ncbi:MAG TPA: TlpA disulfide reductase family protein [Thermoanaerobaculia bacterium]|nr:TlpA disulfide reductase family protein [Thermoanaerobaculia bacterium]
MHRQRPPLAALLLLGAALGCTPGATPGSDPFASPRVVGQWRAALGTPGGELPFGLRITRVGPRLRAVVENGSEEAPFSSVEQKGDRLVLRFDWYDSQITAQITPHGDKMVGTWTRTEPGGPCQLPFHAVRGPDPRFPPVAATGSVRATKLLGDEAAMPSVSGEWSAQFVDSDGTSPAQGEFHQEGGKVTGTFLTPLGDYRYLEGSYEAGLLRLSTFDGAHAFLFIARARADGMLQGDFWSRDRYHATWTARRVAAGQPVLPDAWREVGLTNSAGRFAFRFPDLEGHEVASTSPRFAGKVLLVNLFGSWCPNCNDEAPTLAEWYRRYHDRGLEIVGLAYEYTGDRSRDVQFVRKFAARHGITYPLLLAGTSDKKAAAKTLPDLTAVVAFPTSVFLGRDGKVRKIYSGYAGPGTGEHHQELLAELEKLLDSLLAEPAPAAPS